MDGRARAGASAGFVLLIPGHCGRLSDENYFCVGPKKRSHQSRLKEGFCFLCLYEMVQLHYMPWHALDVAWGDGHTQAPATRGPGAAGQRLPGQAAGQRSCQPPNSLGHSVCNRGTRRVLQGHSQASSGRPGTRRSVRDSQGLAGRAEGPVGAPG